MLFIHYSDPDYVYPAPTRGKLANCAIWMQKLQTKIVRCLPSVSCQWALRTLKYFGLKIKKKKSKFISGENYSKKNVEILSGFNF